MKKNIKDEFISTLSHEIRTPLTSIKGFAQTMLNSWDKLDDEKKKEQLESKINKLKSKEIDINSIINHNLSLDKIYTYIDGQLYEKIYNAGEFIDFVKIGLTLIPGPAYLFKTSRYINLNYNNIYLPYKYYLVDLLLNKPYKEIVNSFNTRYNITNNQENTNIFIDSIY